LGKVGIAIPFRNCPCVPLAGGIRQELQSATVPDGYGSGLT